jgi:ribosomal protein S20
VTAISSIDKAAKNNLIHKKTADRQKSRLEKSIKA